MLNKRIPRSKKIGVIGLAALVLLGAFLLPMAKADKTTSEETSTLEAVSNLVKDVEDAEGFALDEHLEPGAVGWFESPPEVHGFAALPAEPIDAVGLAELDDELARRRSGIQKAQAVIAKDVAKIERSKRHIKALRQEIQKKFDMLHEMEAELKLMQLQLGLNAKADDYVLGVPTTSEPRRTMHYAHVAVPTSSLPEKTMHDVYLGTATPRQPTATGFIRGPSQAQPLDRPPSGVMMGGIGGQRHSSDAVRNELQRILPGLLREMLPRLLAEAMTKAAGNNEPFQQSMTEPMMWRRIVPPKMAPPRTGALTIPPPRMPAPRVKTRPDDTVDGFSSDPLNEEEPPAIPRKY